MSRDRLASSQLRYALSLCVGTLIGLALAGVDFRFSWDGLRVHSRAAADAARGGDRLGLEEQLAQLRALGYVGEADADLSETGVMRHDPDRAHSGVNLYNPAHAAEAYLIDMKGEVLHRWALPLERAFPGEPPSETNHYWRRVRLLDDGGLLAIYEGTGVVRIDLTSSLVWARRNGAHHDLDFTPDGRLAVLRRDAHVNPKIHASDPVLEDFIALLDPETGEPLGEISIYDAFDASPYASALQWRRGSGDIFHTNTLQVIDGRHAGAVPAFARGNFLISLRELSRIAVVDAASRRVVWSLTGQWKKQHEPQLLDNGNILLFDNQGHGNYSKVIEFDPRSQRTFWGFYGTSANGFRSETMGSQQRLTNGNTLITESNAGRVREVTAGGEEVWLFQSPHRLSEHRPDGSRPTARIAEMQRLGSSAARSVLRDAASASVGRRAAVPFAAADGSRSRGEEPRPTK